MKTNDLMIWDLVSVPHDGKASHYGRVNAIYGNGRIDVLFQDGTSALCSSVDPIPLTQETLEKNGFKMHPTMHFCEVELGNHRVTVQFGYANRVEYVRIQELGMDRNVPSEKTSIYLPHFRFYHELQHALKLCGIEKEIVCI